MSELSEIRINIRERRDRPGKWQADVTKPGSGRTQKNFASYEEAVEFKRAVLKAEKRGLLAVLESPKPRTLGKVCASFLAKKGKEVAPATLETYRFWLERSIVLRLGPSKPIEELTEDHVQADCDSRLAAKISHVTVRAELERLRALLEYARSEGLVDRNVANEVRLPKVSYVTKGWLYSNEIGPFLDCCQLGFRLIAKLVVFTGLRRREVVFLQRGDVDLRNGVIQIRSKPLLGFRTKNDKDRSVPIDPAIAPMVDGIVRRLPKRLDAWVFPRKNGERRGADTTWLATCAQEAALRAGIGRPITFHDLRRTFGAMLIESGVDIYTVSRLMGHSDVRITEKVYAPLSGRFLAKEVSKLGRHLGPLLIRAVETGTNSA